jgi:hypothetical protein
VALEINYVFQAAKYQSTDTLNTIVLDWYAGCGNASYRLATMASRNDIAVL